ncbi:peptidylprolyl isomerase [Chryseobacterium sp. LAM-KRS1]|uniref:peptidylprolyl isomerase n=1 Tax=Chryseobacterium sp. LAM-KRS1 TaxID=2715754 RepID=UPI001551F4B4|nr:peptidylprolyl isomerase [Chryseobacterium sp. LAM-KRS1]
MKKLFFTISLFTAPFLFSQKVVGLKIQNDNRKESTVDLDKDKIALYNEKYFAFIQALKTSADRATIDGLLSEKVKTLVTDKVLQKLKDGIQLEKKAEVFKSGHQTLMDGISYPFIQYKYSDDKSPLPKDLITVLFEEDGRIIGVKPVEKNK